MALYVATVLARRLDEVDGHLIQVWGRSAEPEQRRRFFTDTLRKMAAALQIGVPRLRRSAQDSTKSENP